MIPGEAEEYLDGGDHERECCPRCGKEYEELSDMGCELCDARNPGFIGVVIE